VTPDETLVAPFDDLDDEIEACPTCDGDGGDPGNDYVLPCPTCGGEGKWPK